MKIIPIKTPRVEIHPQENILDWVLRSLKNAGEKLRDGDILVLSSKIVSYFEGQVVPLSEINVSDEARSLAEKMGASKELIQLAMSEADEVIAQTPWVLLTRKHGIYSANAGVDSSNVPKGYAVTWPKDPFLSAQNIVEQLKAAEKLKKFAAIIIDSACSPGRKGTTSVAIGYFGLIGYQELKGEDDLFGNTLRYSALNIVDSLATAANLLMGESKESTPLTIIRDYAWEAVSDTKNDEMVISPSDEMFPIG